MHCWLCWIRRREYGFRLHWSFVHVCDVVDDCEPSRETTIDLEDSFQIGTGWLLIQIVSNKRLDNDDTSEADDIHEN